MFAFLCEYPPRSVKAKKTDKYKTALLSAFRKYNQHFSEQHENLYGVAWYFHNRPTQLDADNISKPIWDALEQTLYKDDKIVKVRYAGTFDLKQPGSITEIPLSSMPEDVYNDFINKIDSSAHLLYVEIGTLNHNLYQIGLEA